jgi:biopolymer transport protein TolR
MIRFPGKEGSPMAMQLGGSRSLNAEPNVTPLIDVLLVLLIIFMVIVPVTPKGLAAMVPQTPRPGQPAPDATIVVQILAGANGAPVYRINDENIANASQLQSELSRIYAIRAEKVMFVKGDPGLTFESIAEAIDIGHAVGVDHIGILTPQVNHGS